MQILLAELERSAREVPIEKVPILKGVLATLTALCDIRLMQRDSAPVPMTDEPLLTVPEVAQRLNISKDMAYELCRTGQLQAVKLGKSVRVKPSALADYLKTKA